MYRCLLLTAICCTHPCRIHFSLRVRWTCTADQSPPRAALIPLLFNPAAIWWSEVAPFVISSSIMGSRSPARFLAFADLDLTLSVLPLPATLWIINAYAKAHGRAARTAGPSDTPLKECPFIAELYIARIHGKVEYPPSMVLTSSAYSTLEQDASYIDFLNFAFTHRHCLLLGFSFVDPAISNVLSTIAKKSVTAVKTHHALLPKSAPEALIQKLASVGVRVEFHNDDDSGRGSQEQRPHLSKHR